MALGKFTRLQTIESCEGSANNGAWVCFRYGEDRPESWQELADFILGYLGPRLAEEIGDLATVSITVTSCGLPQGELSVRPGAMTETISSIEKIADDFCD